MLKHVQVHPSTTEMQRVFTSRNFALDSALLVRLAINTLKQCPKSATDYVAMHSAPSIICAKLSMEHLVVLTR